MGAVYHKLGETTSVDGTASGLRFYEGLTLVEIPTVPTKMTCAHFVLHTLRSKRKKITRKVYA